MNHPRNIHRLPAELLLSIFRFTGTHGGPNKLPGIVIASHVCKHWRYITLQTPSLWTVISISNTEKDYIHHARVWLMRSGVLPVDITVHWDSSWVNRKAEEALGLCPTHEYASWPYDSETSRYNRRLRRYKESRELERQSFERELQRHEHRWCSFKWNTAWDRRIENANVTIYDHIPDHSIDSTPRDSMDFSDSVLELYMGSPRDVMYGIVPPDSTVLLDPTVPPDPTVPLDSILSLDSRPSVHTRKNSFLVRQKTRARRSWSKFRDLL